MTMRVSPSASFSMFGAKLGGLPKEARREVRRAVREAGDDLLQAVRRAAAAWSTRIPAATTIKVGFGARSAGVRIAVSERRAPHAKVHEFPNRGRSIRHPVFGDRDVWVEQVAHPFFRRSVYGNRRLVVNKIEKAIDGVIRGL